MTNVLEYLEESARRFPDKTAVEDPAGRCTYCELMESAKRIGSALSAACPARTPVAVFMDKSVSALKAFLGIVYAGCFYIFISPDQPNRRIEQILAIADAGCIVTDQPQRLLELGAAAADFEALAGEGIDEDRLQTIRAQSLDIDPLYCNFTSGSTGMPKGVLVSHRSVIDFMEFFPGMFHITGEDVIGNQAPFDFDVSVKDIYAALKVGATLVLIPKKLFSIVTRLLDYLCDRGVTTLIWAVSALCLVVQFKGLTYRRPEAVNKILFSGEMMPVKYLQLWRRALPAAAFVNLYGPTEITCNCTYYPIDRDFRPEEQIPIGRPFPNEKVFLLDEHDQIVTENDKLGEICVSGTSLALGYYNDREQTERAFVQNPLNLSYMEPIYRTGDLASYNGDGDLCFAGRKDFQVKYMGRRIELEEIETAVNSFPEVQRACCVFNQVRNRLEAFYSGDIEPLELKKGMYGLVPEYMIPAVFHQMDVLPATPNGKLDRKKLAGGARRG